MSRLMLPLILLAGCAFNPNRDRWTPVKNPTCDVWGHVVQCATMSNWLFVPGAITVALFFPAFVYILADDASRDKNGRLYQLIIHPLATALALAGLLCAGLSIGYDERITDGNYAPWLTVGIVGIVLTVKTMIKYPLPPAPPER